VPFNYAIITRLGESNESAESYPTSHDRSKNPELTRYHGAVFYASNISSTLASSTNTVAFCGFWMMTQCLLACAKQFNYFDLQDIYPHVCCCILNDRLELKDSQFERLCFACLGTFVLSAAICFNNQTNCPVHH